MAMASFDNNDLNSDDTAASIPIRDEGADDSRGRIVPYCPNPDKPIRIKGIDYYLCSDKSDAFNRPRGAFGAILKVKSRADAGKVWVVKCPTDLNSETQRKSLRAEIEIYGRLGVGHRYVTSVAAYEVNEIDQDGEKYYAPFYSWNMPILDPSLKGLGFGVGLGYVRVGLGFEVVGLDCRV